MKHENGFTEDSLVKKKLSAIHILTLIIVLCSLILVLYQEYLTVGGFGFSFDDAWIHLQFAKNIVNGEWFSFNHNTPTAGSTSPLWTLLLALGFLVSKNPIAISKVLGIILTFSAFIYLYKLSCFISKNRLFACSIIIIMAINPLTILPSISGMEIMLYVTLTIGGLYYHLLYRLNDGAKQYISMIFFGLAGFARPECFMFLALPVTDRLFVAFSHFREGNMAKKYLNPILIYSGLALCFIGSYFTLNYSIGGHILPNTFYAKATYYQVAKVALINKISLLITNIFKTLFYTFRFWYLEQFKILFVLFIVGIISLLITTDAKNNFKSQTKLLMGIIFLYPIICGFFVNPAYYPAMQRGRYIVHLTILFITISVIGLFNIVQLIKHTKLKIILIVIALLIFSFEAKNNLPFSKKYAQETMALNNIHVNIGKWINTHTLPNSVIAATDIGAIKYFSERETIDLCGLTTPEILPYIYKYKYPDQKSKGITEYLKTKQPDYLALFSPDYWYSPPPDIRNVLTEVYFAKSKYYLSSNSMRTMVLYKLSWGEDQL